jgi:DASH complex subunit ASK1
VNETPSEREDRHEEVISEQEKDVNQLSDAIYESNVIGSENSFLPSQAAFASTPARHVQDSFATQISDDPSWTASIESPLKRLKKNLNPFLPPDVPPAEWNGVIDLGGPSVLTPRRNRRPASNRPTTPFEVDDDDDSFIGLIPGMSPLVTMSPARPPRSSAELGLLKVGQTPAREASTRIKRDLLRDAQIRSGGQKSRLFSLDCGDSKSGTLPTPPSFSRYTRNFDYSTSRSITKDSSLENMMNRLEDIDSDSDSLDEVNNTAHPSAAFIMASQGSHPYDDSFDSSNHSDDSLRDEDVGTGLVPIHPFANAVEDDGFDDDDSFDGFVPAGGNFQEETVFGVPPGERERIHAEGLRMMGQELLEDTIGKGAQIGTGAEDSPTPASWAR